MPPDAAIDPQRLLDLFLTLVQIDSPTGQEAEIGRHLAGRLRGLGCAVSQDSAGNLIARLPGQGEATLLLSAHMDTVGSDTGIRPLLRDGVVYSDGRTILGADDKSGVAAILEALTVLQAHPDWAHPPLEIVITVSEEVGLTGAKQVDTGQLTAAWGVVLDAGGPIGTMVYTAPSQRVLDITVLGKKAHAGAEPEKGINAIVVAAAAIVAMPLGRIDAETTANIGVIAGGEATNIVPDRVTMRGEARSRNLERLDAQLTAMTTALEQAAAAHNAQVEIAVRHSYETYCITPDQPAYRAAQQAITQLGFPFRPKPSGGGTDGNIYTAAGIPCVVLSTGMADVHTTAEHIAVQDLVDSARVLITLICQQVAGVPLYQGGHDD
ncbi:MAG: M20/M25/M40 family metallo-hydrolase [Caldilineales bacterium]|nr:M20/M25/M40 family metallo-hydrolase [Caldilineales bacterium]